MGFAILSQAGGSVVQNVLRAELIANFICSLLEVALPIGVRTASTSLLSQSGKETRSRDVFVRANHPQVRL